MRNQKWETMNLPGMKGSRMRVVWRRRGGAGDEETLRARIERLDFLLERTRAFYHAAQL